MNNSHISVNVSSLENSNLQKYKIEPMKGSK